MDHDLRNGLWNDRTRVCWEQAGLVHYPGSSYLSDSDPSTPRLCRSLWADFFKQPLDTLLGKWDDVLASIRAISYSFKWYEVYDFIEFAGRAYPTVK